MGNERGIGAHSGQTIAAAILEAQREFQRELERVRAAAEAAARAAEKAARAAATRARAAADKTRADAAEARRKADASKKAAEAAASNGNGGMWLAKQVEAARQQAVIDAADAAKKASLAALAAERQTLAEKELDDKLHNREKPSEATRKAQIDVDAATDVDTKQKKYQDGRVADAKAGRSEDNPSAQTIEAKADYDAAVGYDHVLHEKEPGVGSVKHASHDALAKQKAAEDAARAVAKAQEHGGKASAKQLGRYEKTWQDWQAAIRYQLRAAGDHATAHGKSAAAAIDQQWQDVLQHVRDHNVYPDVEIDKHFAGELKRLKAESPEMRRLMLDRAHGGSGGTQSKLRAAEDAKYAIDEAKRSGGKPTEAQLAQAKQTLNDWLDSIETDLRQAGVHATAHGQDPSAAVDAAWKATLEDVRDGGGFVDVGSMAHDPGLGRLVAQLKAETPEQRKVMIEGQDAQREGDQQMKAAIARLNKAGANADPDLANQVQALKNAYGYSDHSAPDDPTLSPIGTISADYAARYADLGEAHARSVCQGLLANDPQRKLLKTQQAYDAWQKALELKQPADQRKLVAHDGVTQANTQANLDAAQHDWDKAKASQVTLRTETDPRTGRKTVSEPPGYDETFWLDPDKDANDVVRKDGKLMYETEGGHGTKIYTPLNPVAARLWEAKVRNPPASKAYGDDVDALQRILNDQQKIDITGALHQAPQAKKDLAAANATVARLQDHLIDDDAPHASHAAELASALLDQKFQQARVKALHDMQALRDAQFTGLGTDGKKADLAKLMSNVREDDKAVTAAQNDKNSLLTPAQEADKRATLKTEKGDLAKLDKTNDAKGHKLTTAEGDKRDRMQAVINYHLAELQRNAARRNALVAPALYAKTAPDLSKTHDLHDPDVYNDAKDYALTWGITPGADGRPQLKNLPSSLKPDDVKVTRDGNGQWYVTFDKSTGACGDSEYSTTAYGGKTRDNLSPDVAIEKGHRYKLNPDAAKFWEAASQSPSDGSVPVQSPSGGSAPVQSPSGGSAPVQSQRAYDKASEALDRLGLDPKSPKLWEQAAQVPSAKPPKHPDPGVAPLPIDFNVDQGPNKKWIDAQVRHASASHAADVALLVSQQTAIDAMFNWQQANFARQMDDANRRGGRAATMTGANWRQDNADALYTSASKAIADWRVALSQSAYTWAEADQKKKQAAYTAWTDTHPFVSPSEARAMPVGLALQAANAEFDRATRARNAGTDVIAKEKEQQLYSANLSPAQQNDPHALYDLFTASNANAKTMAQATINQFYRQNGGQPIEMQNRTQLRNLVALQLGFTPDTDFDPTDGEAATELVLTHNLFTGLVDAQREMVDKTVDGIIKDGGNHAKVTVLPVVYAINADADKGGGIQQTAIFKVESKHGDGSTLVDEQGQRYKDVNDYRERNTLPVAHVRLAMPKDGEYKLDADGNVKLFAGDAHKEGTYDHWSGRVSAVVGGVAVVAGTLLAMGSGGVLAPVLPVVLEVSGGFFAATTGKSLYDRYQHGQSLTDRAAVMDWLTLASSMLMLPVMGAAAREATLAARARAAGTEFERATASPLMKALNVAAGGTGMAAMADGGDYMLQNWGSMSDTERETQGGMFLLNLASLGFGASPLAKRLAQSRGYRPPSVEPVADVAGSRGEVPATTHTGEDGSAPTTGGRGTGPDEAAATPPDAGVPPVPHADPVRPGEPAREPGLPPAGASGTGGTAGTPAAPGKGEASTPPASEQPSAPDQQPIAAPAPVPPEAVATALPLPDLLPHSTDPLAGGDTTATASSEPHASRSHRSNEHEPTSHEPPRPKHTAAERARRDRDAPADPLQSFRPPAAEDASFPPTSPYKDEHVLVETSTDWQGNPLNVWQRPNGTQYTRVAHQPEQNTLIATSIDDNGFKFETWRTPADPEAGYPGAEYLWDGHRVIPRVAGASEPPVSGRDTDELQQLVTGAAGYVVSGTSPYAIGPRGVRGTSAATYDEAVTLASASTRSFGRKVSATSPSRRPYIYPLETAGAGGGKNIRVPMDQLRGVIAVDEAGRPLLVQPRTELDSSHIEAARANPAGQNLDHNVAEYREKGKALWGTGRGKVVDVVTGRVDSGTAVKRTLRDFVRWRPSHPGLSPSRQVLSVAVAEAYARSPLPGSEAVLNALTSPELTLTTQVRTPYSRGASRVALNRVVDASRAALRGDADAAAESIGRIADGRTILGIPRRAFLGIRKEGVTPEKIAELRKAFREFGEAVANYHDALVRAGLNPDAVSLKVRMPHEYTQKRGEGLDRAAKPMVEMPSGYLIADTLGATAEKIPGVTHEMLRAREALSKLPPSLQVRLSRIVAGENGLDSSALTLADRRLLVKAFDGEVLPSGGELPERIRGTVKTADGLLDAVVKAVDDHPTGKIPGLTDLETARVRAAKEGEEAYAVVRDMAGSSTITKAAGAFGPIVNLEHPGIGGAAKRLSFFGALINATNRALTKVPQFDPTDPIKSGVAVAAFPGEIIGNGPGGYNQGFYQVAQRRVNAFSALEARVKAGTPLTLEEKQQVLDYLERRGRKMQRLEYQWSIASGERLPLVGGRIQARSAEQLASARATQAAEGDVQPSIAPFTPKWFLARQQNSAARVKTIVDTLERVKEGAGITGKLKGEDLSDAQTATLVKLAKDEAGKQKGALQTAGDMMVFTSMYRYSALSALAFVSGKPVLGSVLLANATIANSGWLRIVPMSGNNTLYFPGMKYLRAREIRIGGVKIISGFDFSRGIRTGVTGLYEGNGMLGVGKRLGRAYNEVLESPALHGGEVVYANNKRLLGNADAGGLAGNLADKLHLTSGSEAAARRKAQRAVALGLISAAAYYLDKRDIGVDKLFASDDDDKKKDDKNPVTTVPTTTPSAATPTSSPSPSPSPSPTASATPSPLPSTSPPPRTGKPPIDEPSPPDKTQPPPPAPPPADVYWTVDGRVKALSSFTRIAEAVAERDHRNFNQALDQLFNLNRQYKRSQMDGYVSPTRLDDPDALNNGTKINTGVPARDRA